MQPEKTAKKEQATKLRRMTVCFSMKEMSAAMKITVAISIIPEIPASRTVDVDAAMAVPDLAAAEDRRVLKDLKVQEEFLVQWDGQDQLVQQDRWD